VFLSEATIFIFLLSLVKWVMVSEAEGCGDTEVHTGLCPTSTFFSTFLQSLHNAWKLFSASSCFVERRTRGSQVVSASLRPCQNTQRNGRGVQVALVAKDTIMVVSGLCVGATDE
jgi:hypothetical protein